MTEISRRSAPPDSVVGVWTDPNTTLPFFKGRVALFGILRAAGIGAGDEVVLPGFTCVVVPAAILYTGARPVFYDINPRQLNGDPEAAVSKIGARTRAVIVQHTFGVPAELGSLPDVCRKHGILLIEDCAHALGASLGGRQVGTLGDAAFASLQWSKPVTTGLGGLARVNSDELWKGLREFHDKECVSPTWREEIFLSLASIAHAKFFRPSLFWKAQGIYRRLGRMGIVKGSSERSELVSREKPENYAKRFGRRRQAMLAATLKSLPEVIEHRRTLAKIYNRELRTWDIPLQEEPVGARSVPLRIPIRVLDREKILNDARHQHIELGDWFNAPLHPADAPLSTFGYEPGTCRLGERAASELINLPTHSSVGPDTAARLLEFLWANKQLLAQHPIDSEA